MAGSKQDICDPGHPEVDQDGREHPLRQKTSLECLSARIESTVNVLKSPSLNDLTRVSGVS